MGRMSAQAHPGVHARMLRNGWDKRPGVRIIFGRWCGPPCLKFLVFALIKHIASSCFAFASSCQGRDERNPKEAPRVHRQEAVGQLGREFDGIFFDTYSEYYEDMRCACPHTHAGLKGSKRRVSTAVDIALRRRACALYSLYGAEHSAPCCCSNPPSLFAHLSCCLLHEHLLNHGAQLPAAGSFTRRCRGCCARAASTPTSTAWRPTTPSSTASTASWSSASWARSGSPPSSLRCPSTRPPQPR